MVRSLTLDMIEEAAPSHVAAAARLSPAEIYKAPRVPVKGKGEQTKSDRNRIRRQMKAAYKIKEQQADTKLRTLARLDPRRQASVDKRDALKALSRHKNVTITPQMARKHGKAPSSQGGAKAGRRSAASHGGRKQ